MNKKDRVIRIRGARVNNLKNVDVDIPLEKITCINGPSGSGKSSLAFHTLYGESKRRYLNSFPTYLRFFSERPAAADVDEIQPVLPAFGLHQVNPVIGPRSAVVDVMGMTPLLQNYFYRYSKKVCPRHKVDLVEGSIEAGLHKLVESSKGKRFYLFVDKSKYLEVHSSMNLPSYSFDGVGRVELSIEHDSWEFARFSPKNMRGAIEQIQCFVVRGIKDFSVLVDNNEKLKPIKLSHHYKCPQCDIELKTEKRLHYFSPYNALGACSKCSGYGANLEYDDKKFFNTELSISEQAIGFLRHKRFSKFEKDLLSEAKNRKWSLDTPIKNLPDDFYEILKNGGGTFCGLNSMIKYLEKRKYKPFIRMMIRTLQKEVLCEVCDGTRIAKVTKYFGVEINKNKFVIGDFLSVTISSLFEKFLKIKNKELVAIKTILELACQLGLGHLDLLRKTKSLSAGEYQRLLLMKYLSFEGTSSLFVFDEPSLGLSQLEQKWLFGGFKKLSAQGNTVIIVDHSEFLAGKSDHLIEMGPGAGELGGKVLSPSKIKKKFIIDYPTNKLIEKQTKAKKGFFGVKKPMVYGKSFPSVYFPYNKMSLVTGASGSGKTAVITHCIANYIKGSIGEKALTKIEAQAGEFYFDSDTSFKDVTLVDANLNRYTSRSSVGSMTGFAGIVRKHFATTAQAKSMGLKDGHFSSNSKLGQCSICDGKGHLIVEMQFLEDVLITCENCDGRKLEPRYAEVYDGKYEAWEVFKLPFSQVVEDFKLTPKFKNLWEYTKLLNIGYLALDRTMMSLSGGERQRLYLLAKMSTKLENQLLIFENLSFGLSAREIEGVGKLLMQLVARGNTIILIDQNPLFKGFADYSVSF